VPREWFEGLIARGLGEEEQARTAFLAARDRAAARVPARPDDGVALIFLALVDARLGRKEEAIAEAERAIELHVLAKDELQRRFSTIRFASILARFAETDRALELLEQTTALPGGSSYGALKLNEEWDVIRDHPRFQKILASLAPKDTPPAAR
jgi:tetratricopeptide (TPR) repeat protein